MDIRKIEKIINLIKNTNITEINIINNEKQISIKQKILKKKKLLQENNNTIINNTQIIKSPMVGIINIINEKNNELYIKINKKITKGDILFTIESMKTIHYIKSNYTGIISNIFIKNLQTIEYNQKIIELLNND